MLCASLSTFCPLFLIDQRLEVFNLSVPEPYWLTDGTESCFHMNLRKINFRFIFRNTDVSLTVYMHFVGVLKQNSV